MDSRNTRIFDNLEDLEKELGLWATRYSYQI